MIARERKEVKMEMDYANGLIKRATRADVQRKYYEAANGEAVKWTEMRTQTER